MSQVSRSTLSVVSTPRRWSRRAYLPSMAWTASPEGRKYPSFLLQGCHTMRYTHTDSNTCNTHTYTRYTCSHTDVVSSERQNPSLNLIYLLCYMLRSNHTSLVCRRPLWYVWHKNPHPLLSTRVCADPLQTSVCSPKFVTTHTVCLKACWLRMLFHVCE